MTELDEAFDELFGDAAEDADDALLQENEELEAAMGGVGTSVRGAAVEDDEDSDADGAPSKRSRLSLTGSRATAKGRGKRKLRGKRRVPTRRLRASIHSDDDEDEPAAAPSARRKTRGSAAVDTSTAYDSGDDVQADAEDEAFIDTANDDQDLLREYRKEQRFADGERDRQFEDAESARRERARLKAEKKMSEEELERRKEEERQREAEALLGRMREAYEADNAARAEGKPAIHKIKMVRDVERRLTNAEFANVCLRNNLLAVFTLWLKFPRQGELPALDIRTRVFRILLNLRNVDLQHLRQSDGLGKLLKLIAQHPDETKLNRASLLTLLQKWSRIVVRKSDDFRDIRSLVEERGTAHQRMARRGEYMLDIYNRQARAGAASAAGDAGGAGDLVEAALQQGEAGGTDAMHARVPRPLAFDYTRNVESAVDAEAARRRVKGRVDTEKAKFVKAVTSRPKGGGGGGGGAAASQRAVVPRIGAR